MSKTKDYSYTSVSDFEKAFRKVVSGNKRKVKPLKIVAIIKSLPTKTGIEVTRVTSTTDMYFTIDCGVNDANTITYLLISSGRVESNERHITIDTN